MPERKPAQKSAQKTATTTAANAKKGQRLTGEELAAMKDRLQELRAGKADGEADLLAKLAAMQAPDRAMGERLHAIIKAAAPILAPKTWYGMPAYAKEGQVICFFQSGQKFKTRYATLGFSDKAKLDDGHMWPTAFALKELTPAEESRIVALVKRAAG